MRNSKLQLKRVVIREFDDLASAKEGTQVRVTVPTSDETVCGPGSAAACCGN
jgi:hypothetical protein